jgi:hypothetical protein
MRKSLVDTIKEHCIDKHAGKLESDCAICRELRAKKQEQQAA